MDFRQSSSLSTLIFGAIYRQEASSTLTNDSLWLCKFDGNFDLTPSRSWESHLKLENFAKG